METLLAIWSYGVIIFAVGIILMHFFYEKVFENYKDVLLVYVLMVFWPIAIIIFIRATWVGK